MIYLSKQIRHLCGLVVKVVEWTNHKPNKLM